MIKLVRWVSEYEVENLVKSPKGYQKYGNEQIRIEIEIDSDELIKILTKSKKGE